MTGIALDVSARSVAARWTATAEDSPVQTPGDVQTVVVFSNGAGKSFSQPIRYSGDPGQLAALCRSIIEKLDPQTDELVVIAPGTRLDLADPDPVVVTYPDGFEAWAPLWGEYVKIERLFSQRLPSVTQERVEAAYAEQLKLFDPAFEAFV